MNKKRQAIQFSLVFTGLLLILGTYFLYPFIINKNKVIIIEESITEGLLKTDNTTDDSNYGHNEFKSNVFEKVQYEGLYNYNKPFVVKSDKAYVLESEPDVVYMTTMHVILEMGDGKNWVITSEKGSYNKITYDCFFQKNVKTTDGKTVILSENVDLLASEDYASVYNNVIVNDEESSLIADKIDYDFNTEL